MSFFRTVLTCTLIAVIPAWSLDAAPAKKPGGKSSSSGKSSGKGKPSPKGKGASGGAKQSNVPKLQNPRDSPQVKAWLAKYQAAKKKADVLRPNVQAAERRHESLLERSDKAALERGAYTEHTTFVMRELREAKERHESIRERVLGRLAEKNTLYAESKAEYSSAQAELKKLRSERADPKELGDLSRMLTELKISINQLELDALDDDGTYKLARQELEDAKESVDDLRNAYASGQTENPFKSEILASKRELDATRKPYFEAMRQMTLAKQQAEGVYRKLAVENQLKASAVRQATNKANFQKRQQEMRQRLQNLRNRNNGNRGKNMKSKSRRRR